MSVLDYWLWYQGAAVHEVLNEAKQKLTIDTAKVLADGPTVTGKQMAERLMENMEFEARKLNEYPALLGRQPYQATKRFGRDIDHVHEACSDEIRSTWDRPQISEEEFQAALFVDAAKGVLDKIPDEMNADFFL